MIWDEWDSMVLFFNRVCNEGLSLRLLLEPHNEHELFFPRLVALLLLEPTHGNVRVFMFITQGMAIAVYILYLRYIHSEQIMYFAPILIGLIHFDLIQQSNFLWGFQFAYYTALFAGVVAFYCLQRQFQNGKIRYVILTNLFATIAAYSSLQGFICWGVLLAIQVVWGIRERQVCLPMVLSNIVICGIQIGIYVPLYHASTPLNTFSIKFAVAELASVIIGGNQLEPESSLEVGVFGSRRIGIGPTSVIGPSLPVVVGSIVLVCSVILCIILLINLKIPFEQMAFPFMLIAYGYGFIILTALGRYDPTLAAASSSRYMTWALLPYLGVVLLIIRLPTWCEQYWSPVDTKNLPWRSTRSALLSATACAFILSNIIGYANVLINKSIADQDREYLATYDIQPLEALTSLYPWGGLPDMYLKFDLAKELGWGVFQEETVRERFARHIRIYFTDGHSGRITQVFFDTGNGFQENESIQTTIFAPMYTQVRSDVYTREYPQCAGLRIDPVSDEQPFNVTAVELINGEKSVVIAADEIPEYFEFTNINCWHVENSILIVEQTENGDPIWTATQELIQLYEEIMA